MSTFFLTTSLIITKNAGWQYMEDMQEARSGASATVVEVIFVNVASVAPVNW